MRRLTRLGARGGLFLGLAFASSAVAAAWLLLVYRIVSGGVT